MANENIVLICGKSATGKTASLRNIKNPEGVMYLNAEANKSLPFNAKFAEHTVTDPEEVYKGIATAEGNKDIHTIVLDSLTFLLDMYETIHIHNSQDSRKAWGDFQQYFKKLMQQYVAKSSKNIIIIAHTTDDYNEKELATQTYIKVKGALKNQGIEAYFNQVIATKKVPLYKLEEYDSPYLNITEDDEFTGIKYVFQTRDNDDSRLERIRCPIGMWSRKEIFIDNDIQHVLDRIHTFYK
jgi:hypothetical protein